jgi:hypothetical protein
MPPAKSTRSKKAPTTPWFNGTVDITTLSKNEQLAHRLVSQRSDLTPSVQRIMDADLTEEARDRALTAFNDSLGRPGDPNRDPRLAIINARESVS